MRKLVTFAIAGLLAQLVDGALGMAYGVTATSLILTSGGSAVTASASVHLAEVGTTLASGFSHWRFGNVDWRTVRWLALPGAVGAFLGASVLTSIDAEAAKPYVSVLLLALGTFVLARFAFGVMRKPAPNHRLRGRFLGPLGLGAGFLDAVGGGGWGPVTTPTLLTAGRMEPRRAVGSASASEFLVSLAASIGFLLGLGRQGIDFMLAGALLAGGVLAAPLAAWLVHRLNARVMGTLVGGLIILTNTRTLLLALDAPGVLRLTVLAALALGTAILAARSSALARQDRASEARSSRPLAAAAT